MVEMKTVVEMAAPLTKAERLMLSEAYKKASDSRRNSLRTLLTFDQDEDDQLLQDTKSNEVISLCEKVLVELGKICGDIIHLLEVYLIPKADTIESKVFYLQMKGDYYRYIVEFICNNYRGNYALKSGEAYHTGTAVSKGLRKAHPYRLGIALNYSVYKYEIMRDADTARSLAAAAFNEGVKHLDELDGQDMEDTLIIMRILTCNLKEWDEETRNKEPQ